MKILMMDNYTQLKYAINKFLIGTDSLFDFDEAETKSQSIIQFQLTIPNGKYIYRIKHN